MVALIRRPPLLRRCLAALALLALPLLAQAQLRIEITGVGSNQFPVAVARFDAGGSTLRDFSNAKGESGYFQLDAMVYGRAGQPCRVCAQPVKAIRQGQRSTFYCPLCQTP